MTEKKNPTCVCVCDAFLEALQIASQTAVLMPGCLDFD